MISCHLEVKENVDDLYKIFLSEKISSNRATCNMKKNKTLRFELEADDPVSMRALLTSILKIIEIYNKTSKSIEEIK